MVQEYKVTERLTVAYYITADTPEHARDIVSGLLSTEHDECLSNEIISVEIDTLETE